MATKDDHVEAAISEPAAVISDTPQGSQITVKKKGRKAKSEQEPFRLYVKNRGRSERIANMQGKNYFEFDKFGTGSKSGL